MKVLAFILVAICIGLLRISLFLGGVIFVGVIFAGFLFGISWLWDNYPFVVIIVPVLVLAFAFGVDKAEEYL